MDGKPEPDGLVLHGLTLMTTGSDGPEVYSDPVVIAADHVDLLIQREEWKAGQLNGVKVSPPRSEWPDRWKGLQTDAIQE